MQGAIPSNEINISHLRKRKIIDSKMPFLMGYVIVPWRVRSMIVLPTWSLTIRHSPWKVTETQKERIISQPIIFQRRHVKLPGGIQLVVELSFNPFDKYLISSKWVGEPSSPIFRGEHNHQSLKRRENTIEVNIPPLSLLCNLFFWGGGFWGEENYGIWDHAIILVVESCATSKQLKTGIFGHLNLPHALEIEFLSSKLWRLHQK